MDVTQQFLATLLPQEAKVLRRPLRNWRRSEPTTLREPRVGNRSWWAIAWRCATSPFLGAPAQAGGNPDTLLAAVQPEALVGLRITPELGRQLHELGLTVKIELTSSGDFNPDLN